MIQSKSNEKDKWRGNGTILIVDDEQFVIGTARRMLQRVGFDVLTATDGVSALAVFREHLDEIVCVVLDLAMPHMDGQQAFHEMRQLKNNIRIIVSSGFSEREISERFAGKSLDGFLQKPYLARTLEEKLKEVLG